MKKFVIFFFLVSISSSYSQILKGYGIKIGGTISHQNWDYTPISPVRGFDPDNKIGFNIGVFAELIDIPNLRLVTELNYVQKGIQKEIVKTESEYPDGVGSVLWKMRIDYLNLSIMVKPMMDLGMFSPYLLIGPRLDYEIGKSLAYDQASFYDEFKKSRLGLKVGLGSEIKIIGLKLVTEFIYDLDFTELYKNENVKVTTDSFDFRIGIYL